MNGKKSVARKPKRAAKRQSQPKKQITPRPVYSTAFGTMFHADIEGFLTSEAGERLRGKVQLVFTSPPFPLRRKKRYGNKEGQEYIDWLAGMAEPLSKLLTNTGSLVVEIGNAWNPGEPTMSVLGVRALLEFLTSGKLHLCQQFVCDNPARLPGPTEWVNRRRIRVKDSFTHVWWMAKTAHPTANNRNVLKPYSASMERLLVTGKYNPGVRPSEHHIGAKSFLSKNGGAIPSNVLSFSNSASSDEYLTFCRKNRLIVHPARMQRGLADFFVRFLTAPGDIVFDPFAGSNTTGAVAEELKRKWVGIEVRKNYAKASRGRFSGVTRHP